jgi:hypothetical protein
MSNTFKDITPLFMWQDRGAVYEHLCNSKPSIPLLVSFVCENRRDMPAKRWRKLNGVLDLPDELAYAVLSAVVEPKRQRINWPKKKSQAPNVPLPFAHDDNYWQHILKHDWRVRNEVRLLNEGSLLPKFIKKKMEKGPWE